MAEYWLISVPGEKTLQQSWETLSNATMRNQVLSTNYKFAIPDLKVGTLDVLVGLSDDMGKLDIYCESVTRKIAQYLGETLEDHSDKLQGNLQVNGVDMVTYLTRFQWDLAKYPIKQSLKNIAEIIGKQVSQIETDLKTKATAYNNLKGNLQNLERKSTGSLFTRNLTELVKREDFVLDSEYLQTLLVVVPKNIIHDWQAKYESLTDMVVPRSSRTLFEDDENCLCSVTLFRKVAEDFRNRCRENRFMVRDFTYNEKDIADGKMEISKLEDDKKKQYGPLVKWLKVNFGESFSAWIHVKALRIFVESVLRYGLPVNFLAVLIQPHKKTTRKLREVMNQLYAHLDSPASQDSGQMEIPGLVGISNLDYYPYVYYKISLDLVDPVK